MDWALIKNILDIVMLTIIVFERKIKDYNRRFAINVLCIIVIMVRILIMQYCTENLLIISSMIILVLQSITTGITLKMKWEMEKEENEK